MENNELMITEYELNTVVEGAFSGEKIIRTNKGYFIGQTPLNKNTFKSIEKALSERDIPSSVRSKISSYFKTGVGLFTLTLPFLSKSAKNDAEKVALFARVTWQDDTTSLLFMQEEIYNEVSGKKKDFFNAALDAGKWAYDKGENVVNHVRLNILKPLSEDEYKSASFHTPSVVKIVDSITRENNKLCAGAIGWREKVNNLEVLCLYNSFVKSSGISFVPNVQNNAIYYENPHKPNQYIMVDELFEEVQNARAAELEQVAYALGAKYFRIEMIDNSVTTSKKEDRAKTEANALNYVKAGSSSSYTADSLQKEGHYIAAETHFAEKREPFLPALSWFSENLKINSLIAMRLGEGGDKIESHSIEIRCSNYSVMNSETAGNLDAVIKKIGVKQNATMKKHFEKERNQKMIYYVEF